MKKYYFIIKIELQRQLTYRIDAYAHRLRDLLEIFALLAVWAIAFKNTNIIAGYSQSQMITYVLVGWFFMSLTRGYGLDERVADEIFEGRLSDFLVKPVSYLKYVVFMSIGRSSTSMLSAVIIQIVVIFAFSKYIVFNLDILHIILLLLMIIASYCINIFMALIIGMIAFWTQRITGIDYTLNTMMKFLAGAYFPIALLPEAFLKFDKIFPFIYTSFIPTQLYLGKISLQEGFYGLLIELAWVFLLYVIIKIMWKRGIRRYEGVGI